MKNTVLNYPNISCNKFTSEDYTSKKISNIRNMKELNDTNWIEYIELYDNQTVEQISYILYKSPDYWDLLLIINNKDPLFDMSYNFDILEKISEDRVQKYLDGYSGVYETDTYNRLKTLVLADEEKINEYNRQFKIIKPERLYDFINLLKDVKL